LYPPGQGGGAEFGLRLGGHGGSPEGDRSGRPIARGGWGVPLAGREAGVLRDGELARTQSVLGQAGSAALPPRREATSGTGSGFSVCGAEVGAGHLIGRRGTVPREAVELGIGGGDGTVPARAPGSRRRPDGASGAALTHNRKGHMLAASKIPVRRRRRTRNVPRGVSYNDSLKRPSF